MPAGLTELTDAEAFVASTSKFIRPARREFTVPDALSGQYVTAVGVVTAVELSEAQQTALQDAIELITGVTQAKVLIGPTRLSLDRMPTDTVDTDYQFKVQIGLQVDAQAVPIAP